MTERQPRLSDSDIARIAATAQAPESLQQSVLEMVQRARQQRPAKRRIAWAPASRRAAFALAGACAAIVLAAVLVVSSLSGGGSSELTPRTAAALALAPATGPAPGESVRHRGELTTSVGGVSFPYWKERFGWRSSGTRTDSLDGRAVTTVFYSNAAGQRLGYAIASGSSPATLLGAGATVRRWGIDYRLATLDGASAIVWRRDGHLCVMAGRGVSPSTLLALASWGERPRRS